MNRTHNTAIKQKSLSGLYAVITGATGGIGGEIARAFAEEGANLFLLGRDETKLALLSERLKSKNDILVKTAQIDLSSDNVQSIFKLISKEFNQLDILVNCAGQMPIYALMMHNLSDVRRCLDINLLGTIQCANYASRLMMRRKQGCIINVSSVVARQGAAFQSVYAASKAGVEGFTKSLAKELAPMNIRVNSIAPGLVDTSLLENISSEKLSERINQIPVSRLCEPSEIASVCVFLASSEASYITGQIIAVDGGLQL